MDTSAFYGTGLNPVFRNKIINGDMRIDQRNAGASVTWSALQTGTYNIDRYQYYNDVVNLMSVQRSTTAPPGFSHSVLFTSLTAAGTQTNKQIWWGQAIEAFNMTDLAWGTADAKPATVSFWVRCSIPGTFGGAIQSSSADLSYPFTFTIAAVNTWQYVTFTVPGPTGGSWTKDSTSSGGSLRFEFNGVGYNSGTGTPNIWTSGNNTGPIGTTRFVATNGATMNITGLQFERGTVATPFEYRPFGTELALCQRYCYVISGDSGFRVGQGWAYSSTSANISFNFPVVMRSSPSLVSASAISYNDQISGFTLGTPVLNASSTTFATLQATGGGGMTARAPGAAYFTSNSSYIILTSEL
jgi:hypothetical protein